ncbi:MAG: desA [Gemmataceae bacterium]|nr:desA [Gemmataceae bacterium]
MTPAAPPRPAPGPNPGTLLNVMAPEHRRRGRARGVALFAADFTTYLVLIGGLCVLPGLWLKGLCAVLTGFTVGRLFGLAHDAAHDNLTSSTRLNRWIARAAFLPALTPLTSWVIDHHTRHHAHLRIRGKDTTWPPLSLAEYRARGVWRRGWYRFLRTPVGTGFYWVFEYWLPYLFWPRRIAVGRRWAAFRTDRLVVCGFVAGLWAGMTVLERATGDLTGAAPLPPPALLLFGVIVPFFVWATVSGVIDFITHTHPGAVWFADRAGRSPRDTLRNTPHIIMPFGTNRLFHNFFDHTAHHVDPRIPLHHLPAAQAELAAAVGEEMTAERFTAAYLLRLFRRCRLYDFDRHLWQDYDGRPTTDPQPVPGR